ncbi:MAG TPA: HAD-IA family hydrolase [Acidisarcina sp.]|nr:HAD-IA family hydrolase [Acidisarcina sp.]
MSWSIPTGCRGLIFDCDGTLVDSMPLHFEVWNSVLHRHNLDLIEDRFYQWAGLPVDQIIQLLADEKGLKVDIPAIAKERDAEFHNRPASELRPVEPVVAIARRYRGQLPMAVATGSTQASAEASLRAIGVLDWFDAVVSSHEAGRPKPAPDVFLLAADRIGIPPADCVALEDGNAGLESARAAGMHAIDIRPWLRG